MSSPPYETWLHTLKDPHDNLPSTEEQNAFLDFLNQKTSTEAAAKAYTNVVTNTKYQTTESLWFLLWLAAEQYPATHPRLVELLKAIKRLPRITQGGKKGKLLRGEYWRGLPGFEEGLREYWDGKK